MTSRMSTGSRLIALVFALAFSNGTLFSLLTPIFQVPDETAHFAYVQHFAETGGRPGVLGRPEFSSEQTEAMDALGTLRIIGHPEVKVPDRLLTSIVASREDGGGPSSASGQPPVYYLLEAIPYRLFSASNLVTRVRAMRMVSVLFFAGAAAFCASMLVDLFPDRLWAPLAGGAAVALSPYTAFIASGITPDSLLLMLSAALALLVVRSHNRGLTRRRALMVGFILGCGLSTKLIFLAFLPPIVVSMALLTLLSGRGSLDRSKRVQCAVACVSGCLFFALLNALWLRFASGGGVQGRGAVDIATNGGSPTNYREIAVYAWQLLLPRLPFMSHQFTYVPLSEIWIDGFAGRYGWLDYRAPEWFQWPFRTFLTAIALLSGYVATTQVNLLRTWPLTATVVVSVGSLFIVIAKTGFDYRESTGFVFEQPRYLFGLVGLYAAAVAASCGAFGRRGAALAAQLLIVLLLVHDLTGVTQTVLRYYA